MQRSRLRSPGRFRKTLAYVLLNKSAFAVAFIWRLNRTPVGNPPSMALVLSPPGLSLGGVLMLPCRTFQYLCPHFPFRTNPKSPRPWINACPDDFRISLVQLLFIISLFIHFPAGSSGRCANSTACIWDKAGYSLRRLSESLRRWISSASPLPPAPHGEIRGFSPDSLS